MTNQELEGMVDTTDQWIRERTGIRKRFVAKKETSGEMAAKAAGEALKDSGLSPKDIDMILTATSSPSELFPNTACQVQRLLDIPDAVCMDLNAACSGFLFALNTAYAWLSTGRYKNILVIGSERLSQMVDWEDRRTCILFGDGAGAAVVTQSPGAPFDFVMGSKGSKGEVLTCPYGGTIAMDGQEVFKFAVRTVPECILQLLSRNHLSVEAVDKYILHQANARIIGSVAKRLSVPEEKFPMNLSNYGNTSAASIPILLDEQRRAGSIKLGDLVVMAGFGAGLTWGAALLQM